MDSSPLIIQDLSLIHIFGHTTMDDIRYFEVQDEIASSLSSMAAISVRDIYSFDIIRCV